MPSTIKTAQRAQGFSSFGATAKALLNAHPDNHWGMQPRSLETQIGKLDRGEITWWTNHDEVAQAPAATQIPPLMATSNSPT